MTEAFQFPDSYNHLLEETPLGQFDFQSMPVIHPEAHPAYSDPTLNRLHLLATAEHEQLHDMLARQTTHGYMILLSIRYFKKLPDAEKDGGLYRQVVQLHEEGRKMHEAYATFGTLSTYRQGEKLEILFSFEEEDFSQLEPEAAAHLSLFASPADYYHKPALRSVADTLVSKGVKLYLMQPLNFLTFLEWRKERELPVQPFVVELVTLPDSGLYLMKVWFGDTPHTYVRLVAQSTFAAVLKLYSLEQPRFSLNLREELNEKDRGIVNFLKVYWK